MPCDRVPSGPDSSYHRHVGKHHSYSIDTVVVMVVVVVVVGVKRYLMEIKISHCVALLGANVVSNEPRSLGNWTIIGRLDDGPSRVVLGRRIFV